MSISAEQIQVFYEIAMSIGTSLDMNDMLKAFLPTLLKRLNCSCGGIVHRDTQRKNGDILRVVYTIPRKPENIEAFRAALDTLQAQTKGGSVSQLRKRLPLSERSRGRSFYHILDLPGFGFLILIKNCTDLDPFIIKSMAPLFAKLAAACQACLQDEALRLSEERFRDLIDSANDLIQSVDAQGRFQFVNKKWLKTLGYSKKELEELTLQDILRPDQIPHCMEAFQQVIQGKAIKPVEAVFIAKDGREVFVEGNVNALRRNGSFISTRGIFRDVTERSQAEQALKKSESKYRSVVEQSAENIFLVDLESKTILEMNDALRKMLGYTRKEMKALTYYDFIAHPKADIDAKIELVLQKGKVVVGERSYRCKDGSHVDVEVSASTITYGDKVVLCVVSRDITDRKHAEEQIKASLKQKEVLLQEIHHRVKNNMQIMMSLLRLQTAGVGNPIMQEKIREYSNRIQTMSMIHQKLYQTKEFSRINFGEYILTLVNQLFKVYSVPPDKIRVVSDLQDVFLDVKQAIPCGLLVNELVSNVFKHAFPHDQKGELFVELCRKEDGRNCLLVKDNGVGFPPEFDIKQSESLGMQLIDDLTGELGGVMEQDHSQGCSFKISF